MANSPTPNKLKGEVSWYNRKAGYGFIQRQDGEPDIFCHKLEIRKAIPTLEAGEQVEFLLKEGRKGIEASKVQTAGHSEETPQRRSRSRRRPQEGEEDMKLRIHTCLQVASTIAGNDKEHLCQIIPMLLRHNNLPHISIPPQALHKKLKKNVKKPRFSPDPEEPEIEEDEEEEALNQSIDLATHQEHDEEDLNRPGNGYEEEQTEEEPKTPEKTPPPKPEKTPPPKPSPQRKPRTRQDTGEKEARKMKAWENEYEQELKYLFKGGLRLPVHRLGWCIPPKYRNEEVLTDCEYGERCRHWLHRIEVEYSNPDQRHKDNVAMCLDTEETIQKIKEVGTKHNPNRKR